jgi:hypothetical protein
LVPRLYPNSSIEAVDALAIRVEDAVERQLAGGEVDIGDIGENIPFED